MQQRFEGIWLPLITPFRNGELDLSAAQKLARHYLDAGMDGLSWTVTPLCLRVSLAFLVFLPPASVSGAVNSTS